MRISDWSSDVCSSDLVPLLPGAATASEAMTLLEQGYAVQKFFPAESAGGVGCLKALAQPLAGITFCPTGGITRESAGRYLALPNVICVGGSWVAPDRKSTRRTPVTNAHLVCRLLLE